MHTILPEMSQSNAWVAVYIMYIHTLATAAMVTHFNAAAQVKAQCCVWWNKSNWVPWSPVAQFKSKWHSTCTHQQVTSCMTWHSHTRKEEVLTDELDEVNMVK